jgi:hypothetical protein
MPGIPMEKHQRPDHVEKLLNTIESKKFESRIENFVCHYVLKINYHNSNENFIDHCSLNKEGTSAPIRVPMVMSLAFKLIAWSILTLVLLTSCQAMQQRKSAEATALTSLVKAIPRLTMNNFETWKHQIAMAMMMIYMSKYLGMDEEFDLEESDEESKYDDEMELRPSPLQLGGIRNRQGQPLPSSSRTMPIPDLMAMGTPNNRRVYESVNSLRNRRNFQTPGAPAPARASARTSSKEQQGETPPTRSQKMTAYSIIWNSLSKGVQMKVKDVKMPNVKKLWLRIKKIFVQDNYMEKHRLTEEFCSQKLRSPEKFDDFVCEIDTRAARLQSLGKVINDNDKISALYAGIRHEELFTGPIQNLQLEKKESWLEITDYLREVILYEKMKHGERNEGAYAMTIQRKKKIYQGKGEYDPKEACRGKVNVVLETSVTSTMTVMQSKRQRKTCFAHGV